MIRRYWLLMGVWAGLTFPCWAADTLDLATVLRMAGERSLPACRARTDLLQARARHRSFRAGLLPQVTLAGDVPNYINSFSQTTQPDGTIAFQRISYNNSQLSLEMTQALATTGTVIFAQSSLQRYDDFGLKVQRFNGVPLRIGVQQAFSAYTPTRWQARLDPIRIREAERQYQFDLEAVRQAALELFFQLLLAQIDLELATANTTNSLILYKLAEERFSLGKISENDLLQLQLEVLNAQKATYDATLARQRAGAQLHVFLQREDTSLIFLISPEMVPQPVISLERALAKAAEHRPEYETWQRQRLEAAEQTAQVKARQGFQATLQASVGYAGSAGVLPPIYQNPQPEQGVALSLTIPLLTWGKNKAEIELAQAEQAYVTAWTRQQALSLETDIHQQVLACQQVAATLRLARDAQDIAQRQYDISQNRYRLGEISTTDLTLSLRAKDLARRAYAASLRDYWTTYQQIRQLTLYDFDQDQPIDYLSE